MRLFVLDHGSPVRRIPRVSGSESYLARLARRRIGAAAPTRIMVIAHPGAWDLLLGSTVVPIGTDRETARLGVEFAASDYAAGRL